MPKKELISVSIPKNILNEVDQIVEESGRYVSRADFCRSAVRDLIKEEQLKIFQEGEEVCT